MVLKVKLLGSGNSGDPYRVALPTYSLLHGNVSKEFAYVSVPDNTVLPESHDLSGEQFDETTEGPFYAQFSSDTLEVSAKHLDTQYPQHAGKFRIDHA